MDIFTQACKLVERVERSQPVQQKLAEKLAEVAKLREMANLLEAAAMMEALESVDYEELGATKEVRR